MAVARAKKKKGIGMRKHDREVIKETIQYYAFLSESVLRSEFGFSDEQFQRFVAGMNEADRLIADKDIVFNFRDVLDVIDESRVKNGDVQNE